MARPTGSTGKPRKGDRFIFPAGSCQGLGQHPDSCRRSAAGLAVHRHHRGPLSARFAKTATLSAQDNLTLAPAADETHSYSKSKKVTRQEDHVSQQITTLTAGGNVNLVAKQGDLTLIASKVEAAHEAYLYAGKDLNVLAAQDSDYSLYNMKKKGSFGAKKTRRDEVTDVRNIGSEIKAGGDITLQSEGKSDLLGRYAQQRPRPDPRQRRRHHLRSGEGPASGESREKQQQPGLAIRQG